MINSYLPDGLRSIPELKACSDCDEEEYQIMLKALDNDLNSIFILNYNARVPGADDYACSRWERVLGIVPLGTDSLSDRQFRIWTKLFNSLPYTKKKLEEVLTNITGVGNYTLTNDVGKKTIKIELFLGVKSKVQSIRELMEGMLPANISYIVDLLYNTQEILEKYTHEELEQYTHYQLEEEILNAPVYTKL